MYLYKKLTKKITKLSAKTQAYYKLDKLDNFQS